MQNQPSAIDQCLRHWNPRWNMSPQQFVGTFRTVVDVQNIRDHAAAHAKANKNPMRVGRLMCPWDNVVFFWKEMTLNAGMAYKLAVITQVHFGEKGSALSIVVLQFESGGQAETIVSGMICVAVPKDGLPKEDENGTQSLHAAVLGFQEATDHAFSLTRAMVTTIATELDLKCLAVAAAMSPDWAPSSQSDMSVVCCALSFLNCKNVVAQEAGRTSPPPKWREAGVPSVKYRIVKIDGRLVKKAGESSAETGRNLSLHICRGSFAHYTADKPLFGKHVGDFWRPQHTRGSGDVGEIVKTYKLVPPVKSQ